MELRTLRADEGLAYRALRLRALEQAPEAFAQTLADAIDDPDDLWHALARSVAGEGRRALFVVDRGDGSLGGSLFVAVDELPPYLAELGAMWVDADLREAGWPDRLMETALDWARQWEAEGATLWVTTANDRARRFFEHHGFETGAADEGWQQDGVVQYFAPL